MLADASTGSLHTVLSASVLLLLVAALSIFVYSSSSETDDGAREPPVISSTIPLVEHLLNIIRHGSDGFLHLRSKHHRAVYSLPVLGWKYYIIASPTWAVAAQKQYRTVSFNGIVIGAMKTICDLDAATLDIVREDVYREQGEDGFLAAQHTLVACALAQGSPQLAEVERGMTRPLAATMNRLAVDRQRRAETIPLVSWVRRNLSLVALRAFYGPRHPFALQHVLEADFQSLEAGTLALMVLPWPAVTARKIYRARRKLLRNFEEYVEEERYQEASEFVQEKIQFSRDRGFSARMAGRGKLSFAFAAIANLVPSTSWLLSWIFADATLLADLRQEVDRCVSAPPRGSFSTGHRCVKVKGRLPALDLGFLGDAPRGCGLESWPCDRRGHAVNEPGDRRNVFAQERQFAAGLDQRDPPRAVHLGG